ncbi:LysR family transcriptional regulator [Achromobacter piechaudii]|uniref:LysR substrate binding domain protein n=1 Tax=Achromobacter piechaudii ATCC 43553 TaxID=742159 RepID=D4X5X6_9BURK|nr:LysR family transcriptional regulator [Achromobacter piechaudii]EFF77759.1 LysR substrate binding domain protein [Achromobacter piechaudii ATCC 43553]
MTLKQLEAFYWAATCSSFLVAADRLHLSLSSLSKRISELETALGVELFDRSGHRAVLTSAGDLLLPRAQSLIREADDIEQQLKQAHGLRGLCRFGVGELTALTWLPILISNVRLAHPALRLEPTVEAGSSLGGLAQRVSDGSLDFAIAASRSPRENIRLRPVGQAELCWVIGTRSGAPPKSLTAKVIDGLPLITLPVGSGTAAIVDACLEANGLEPASRLLCNSWPVVASLIADGMGFGLLPMGWAVALEKRGKVHMLKTKSSPTPLQYFFLCRRDDHRPLLQEMLRLFETSIDFNRTSIWLGG